MPLRAPKGFIDETDPKVCQIGHPAPPWLVNYADLMTELVCFFVILYALSASLDKATQQAREEVEKMNDPGVSAKIDKEGLKITLEEQNQNVFFESGSAELTPGMQEMMHKIAPILAKLVDKRDVIVEGHTDNVPIRNDLYLSNWELSSARATNVVEHLIKYQGLPPVRLGATGYGEQRPIAPNDTPANRSRNRRVVFFVKSSLSPLGPPSTSAAEAKKAREPSAVPPGEEGEDKTEVGSVDSGGARGFVDDMLSKIKGK